MGKYKGFFIGKEKYFKTEKIHELFIEMDVLDNNVKMDLDSNQTRFQPEVFKKEFREEVFNEIIEVCKNIDVERECFNIKVQFENCIDSETQKIFLSKKMSEYSKELSDSIAYFYYKKSEKEFRSYAIKNIGIDEIYQYVHDKLKDNRRGYFYISYYRFLSNTLILEYLRNRDELNYINNENLNSKNKSDLTTSPQIKLEDNLSKKASKYPLVFKNLETEKLFANFLKEHSAVNENNEPIDRKFKPICHAFYTVLAEEYKPKSPTKKYPIFIVRVNLKDFIDMLVKEYKIKPITKLSNGNSYSSIADDFYKKIEMKCLSIK
ncbi:hypothetical protein TD3509T_60229 [Tenacibaculum dicentrarchi]|uniref:Uncharacterized protein n=1 Tax=Tenacibaculum dicentrarchi TaxID=669041 RepID=A0ABP1EQC1_9FLAO|nr:hypothetical protein TD3509T_60229 [Tenacibaculum dicentrarchi]SOU86873.1 hypothetical protein TDCHD05_30050 [Tenacibaculum dicentrarchi]